MKNLYIIPLCILHFIAGAQKKVDLDPYSFTVQYRSLPQMKIDSTYRTYNVVVEGSRLMRPFLNEMSPEQSVILEGWRKLPDDGHLTIKVNIEDLLPEAISVKERSEVVKDRNGQITGTRIYYYEEVRYSFAAHAIITDYKGSHITDLKLADRGNTYVYKSPEFALKPLAQGYFAMNTYKVTADLYRRCVNNAMHYLSERITDNFGFEEVSIRDKMWIVDSRKHPEYTNHRQAFRILTEILFNMNASSDIEKAREQAKTVIDYFESIKRKYTSTSKHDRKIRYASYYNLAVLYYYLDDPNMMMKEAQGLILNDFDSRDGKGFEKTAIWLRNLFQNNNIYTRHFPIDPAVFKGPYENKTVSVK